MGFRDDLGSSSFIHVPANSVALLCLALNTFVEGIFPGRPRCLTLHFLTPHFPLPHFLLTPHSDAAFLLDTTNPKGNWKNRVFSYFSSGATLRFWGANQYSASPENVIGFDWRFDYCLESGLDQIMSKWLFQVHKNKGHSARRSAVMFAICNISINRIFGRNV